MADVLTKVITVEGAAHLSARLLGERGQAWDAQAGAGSMSMSV